jgi:hypothetical protein
MAMLQVASSRRCQRALGLVLAGAGFACDPTVRAQDPPPAAAPAASERPSGYRIEGYLSSRYWVRWTGDDSDQDLHEVLSLDFGERDRDTVTGHFLGRLAADLDSHRGTSRSSPFFNLSDSFDRAIDPRLYHASVDLNRLGEALERVRVGRQELYDTPVFAYFDGVSLTTGDLTPSRLEFGAWGGASTHLFESSRSGDWLGGGFAEMRPWRGGRVRADWMHIEDDRVVGSRDDDLIGLRVWQTIAERVTLDAGYTRFVERDRDVDVRAAYIVPEDDLVAQVIWHQLLNTQRDLVLELDPFVGALREYDPFWQLGALVSKGVHEHVDVRAAVDLRRVTDRADVGPFNRDYERYGLTVTPHDLIVEGSSLSVTVDSWRSDGQDLWTVGGDLSQRFGDVTVAIGTYYSLFEYELFRNEERDHVRTYFANLRHRVSPSISWDLAYEFEQNDLDDFHTLRLGALWRF